MPKHVTVTSIFSITFYYSCKTSHTYTSFKCVHVTEHIWGRPPNLVRSIQGVGFRRYAVRKWSVRSTQKSCYIVRRNQFLLKKVKYSSRNTTLFILQSPKTSDFSLRATLYGVISAFINLNLDFVEDEEIILANTLKLTFAIRIVHVHATYCHFIFFSKWKHQ